MGIIPRLDREWGLGFVALPSSGENSNYNDPPSLALFSLILFPILSVISLTFVALRTGYNFTTERKLRADDWFILIAVTCATTQTVLDLTERKFARHSWDIELSWLDESFIKKLVFAQSMLAWPSLLFAKLSILTLYFRLFEVRQFMRYAIYAGMLWTVLTYLPFLVITPYMCAPHMGQKWGGEVLLQCNKAIYWEIMSAAMAVLLDAYIFILPLPVLRTLPLSRNKKCGLVAVFTTASFALVCAVLTLVYRVKYNGGGDVFYNAWILIITAVIENNVAITVASVPGVTAFVKRYILRSQVRRLSSSSERYTSSKSAKRRSRGHYALNSIGGTPLGSIKSESGNLNSTTHLSGWREAKDGKVYTEVTNMPGLPQRASVRQPGITKFVEIDQRSSRGSMEGV